MKPTVVLPTTRVWRSKELEFNDVDGDMLALDAQAGFVYSLLGPGARIWELLSSPRTVGEVCTQLRREYAVDEATCLAEVGALVTKLGAAGLIVTDDTTR